MESIQTIKNALNDLKEDVEELETYKLTYSRAIPDAITILKELFESDSIKTLKNYDELKMNYYDKIYNILTPKNFNQLVLETSLPGFYDPPCLRNKKHSTVTKLISDLKKLDGTNNTTSTDSSIPPKKIAKITKIQPYPNLGNDFLLKVQESTSQPQTLQTPQTQSQTPQTQPQTQSPTPQTLQPPTPQTLQPPTPQTLQPQTLQTPQTAPQTELHTHPQTQESNVSSITVKVTDVYREPELMLLKINGSVYYYDSETQKIYQKENEEDYGDPMDLRRTPTLASYGYLVGEIKDGNVIINGKYYPLTEEEVYEMVDPGIAQFFYRSKKSKNSFYEKINESDGWLVGIESDQLVRLVQT